MSDRSRDHWCEHSDETGQRLRALRTWGGHGFGDSVNGQGAVSVNSLRLSVGS